MENWIDYLSVNPIIALALVAILILFLFMVFRKLVKWALISFIILAVAVGVSYNEAQKSELIRQGEKILRKSERILKQSERETDKALNKLKKDLKKKSN